MRTQEIVRTEHKYRKQVEYRVMPQEHDRERVKKIKKSRFLSRGVVILFLLAIAVTILGSINSGLWMTAYNIEKDIQMTENRINEIQYEIDVNFNDLLLRTAYRHSEFSELASHARQGYFVRNNLDVGG